MQYWFFGIDKQQLQNDYSLKVNLNFKTFQSTKIRMLTSSNQAGRSSMYNCVVPKVSKSKQTKKTSVQDIWWAHKGETNCNVVFLKEE